MVVVPVAIACLRRWKSVSRRNCGKRGNKEPWILQYGRHLQPSLRSNIRRLKYSRRQYPSLALLHLEPRRTDPPPSN